MAWLPIQCKRQKGDPRIFVPVVAMGVGHKKSKALALIDTGADGIFVSPRLALACKASLYRGEQTVYGARRKFKDRPAGMWLFIGSASVQAKVVVSVVRPWMASRREPRYDVLIGMKWLRENDVLIDTRSRLLLLWCGPKRRAARKRRKR